MIDVFNALIHSYLRYGIIIWGSASKTTLKPLETLVNKAIRIMSFAPFGNINLSQIYQDFNLLHLSNVHDLEIGKFAYKEKFGYLPTEIGNYFPTSLNFTSHNYGSRVSNSSTVLLDRKIVYRLKSSERSVQFKTNHLWSNLQDSFKSSESLNIFKGEGGQGSKKPPCHIL